MRNISDDKVPKALICSCFVQMQLILKTVIRTNPFPSHIPGTKMGFVIENEESCEIAYGFEITFS